MKKAFIAIALCVSLVGILAFSSCTPPNDSRLVGRWALGTSTVQYCEFTADEFIVGGAGVAVTYQYKASKGTGQYWIEGASIVKLDLAYEFGDSDDSMELTLGGALAVSLTRME